MSTYIRKTRDVRVIQQYFGPQHGWEDVCEAEDRTECARLLRDYRENQPQYPVRRIIRREKIEA